MWTQAAFGDTLRIATYHTELSRKGPGLLLRDILRGEDPQVAAVVSVIARIAPDVLVLQDVDYDYGLVTLTALRDAIAVDGPYYPHLFALSPNRGLDSGADLDGDGRLGEPEDAHSRGWYAGEGGQAILSRHTIQKGAVRSFDRLLWAKFPDPLWPGSPMPGQNAQRLSRTGHWVVPIEVGGHLLRVMSFHAVAPVFDGPEDRNGRRNHDEILFWQHLLDGTFGAAPEGLFVIAGNANLDPVDGEGRKEAIKGLLRDPRLQDPAPRRSGNVSQQSGQRGDPTLDTVAWPSSDPGHLRVSYILPSRDVHVLGSGIHWPPKGPELEVVEQASRHRLVWVDLELGL